MKLSNLCYIIIFVLIISGLFYIIKDEEKQPIVEETEQPIVEETEQTPPRNILPWFGVGKDK